MPPWGVTWHPLALARRKLSQSITQAVLKAGIKAGVATALGGIPVSSVSIFSLQQPAQPNSAVVTIHVDLPAGHSWYDDYRQLKVSVEGVGCGGDGVWRGWGVEGVGCGGDGWMGGGGGGGGRCGGGGGVGGGEGQFGVVGPSCPSGSPPPSSALHARCFQIQAHARDSPPCHLSA